MFGLGIMWSMRVGDLGEFRLIEELAQLVDEQDLGLKNFSITQGFRIQLSIGDDAAVWSGRAGTRIMTTDTLVDGVHFSLDEMSWNDLGWKAMAVNLSDVAAMGCLPLYSVVTLGLSNDMPVDGIIDMYRGMLKACRVHGGAIVGGDIVRSSVFFVTIAMMGTAPIRAGNENCEQPVLTRVAAQPSDKIAVTGDLGRSAGGLKMLKDGLEFHEKISCLLTQAHNRPTPRVAEGIILGRLGVTTLMDISDGLVADLSKLCEASDVGAIVRRDFVPVHGFLKQAYPDDWLNLALNGGEDYELLFTAPLDLVNDVARSLDVPVTIIGDIVSGTSQVRVVDQHGIPMTIDRGGWNHFMGQ